MKLTLIFLFSIVGISFSQTFQHPRKSLDPNLYPFYHGVASGDPLSNQVIIWTRVSDDNITDSVLVEWRIGTDTLLTDIINSGQAYAYESNDWTLKIDVDGLQPNSWYYYDFVSLGKHSIVGRTKTVPDENVDRLRIGVVSCSNYEVGYFEAYKYLMERNDIDAVLHLGDYIYEYGTSGNSIGRDEVEPANEIITLDDYRLRYSHYRLDEDLRKLHQQYPFITVWDDHESANNSWMNGAENHTPGTEGEWTNRKNNSGKAYHEWLPIRSPQPGTYSIYRKIQYGNLMDLYMLDTRIEGRSEQGGDTNDSTRTLLGETQFNWLTNELSNSTAKWKVLGQQVMMAPLELLGAVLNDDQWDGYNYDRQRLYSHIMDNNIDNIIVLTGDIHTSWVNDLPLSNYDGTNCTGSVGVEYVVTSVTSTGLEQLGGIGGSTISLFNPHIKYTNLADKGYLVLDIQQNRTVGNYYYMNDISSSGNGEYFEIAYACNDNERCAELTTESLNANDSTPFAPFYPLDQLSLNENQSSIIVGVYPNPTSEDVIVQFNLNEIQSVNVELINNSGKVVMSKALEDLKVGLNYLKIYMQELPAGLYTLNFHNSDGHSLTRKIQKIN